MPRVHLTDSEYEELSGVSEEPNNQMSDSEYLRARDALINRTKDQDELHRILEKYPHPGVLAEREEARRKEEEPYPGYGRDLSSQEMQEFHQELEEAADREASREVLIKYGRLAPNSYADGQQAGY